MAVCDVRQIDCSLHTLHYCDFSLMGIPVNRESSIKSDDSSTVDTSGPVISMVVESASRSLFRLSEVRSRSRLRRCVVEGLWLRIRIARPDAESPLSRSFDTGDGNDKRNGFKRAIVNDTDSMLCVLGERRTRDKYRHKSETQCYRKP